MTMTRRRRQRIEARLMQKMILHKTVWTAAAGLLLYFLLQLPVTYAFFTSRAETGPALFRAASFADNLALAPGKSKTNDSPGDPGPAFDVAQVVDGQIRLNFGTYPTGNSRNFPSVLILHNISDRQLTLNWRFCANLALFFKTQQQPVTIAPGQQITLGFKLDSSRGNPPGEHYGTLHLSSMNGFITWDLSARLRLAAKSKQGQNENSANGNENTADYQELPESGSSVDQYGSPEQDETVEGDLPPEDQMENSSEHSSPDPAGSGADKRPSGGELDPQPEPQPEPETKQDSPPDYADEPGSPSDGAAADPFDENVEQDVAGHDEGEAVNQNPPI